MKALAQRNIMITFLVVKLLSLSAMMIDLVSQLFFIEVQMLLMNLLKQFLKNISAAKNNEETFQQKFNHERGRRIFISTK